MLTNTLTLTIDSVARTLLRLNQDNFGSVYSFNDETERLTLKIRHDKENQKGQMVNRHNVFVEHTVYATPTSAERFWSTTITLRDREGSGPGNLLKLWQGVNTLVLTFDDTLVAGDN
jgi:hypothetical protein